MVRWGERALVREVLAWLVSWAHFLEWWVHLASNPVGWGESAAREGLGRVDDFGGLCGDGLCGRAGAQGGGGGGTESFLRVELRHWKWLSICPCVPVLTNALLCVRGGGGLVDASWLVGFGGRLT